MYGYGYSYPNNPQGSGLMGRYEAGVRSDGGSFAFPIDTGLASRLEGLGLLNASSLVNSCNAGKESVLYNLVPTPVQSLDRFAVTRSTVKWVLGANGVLTSIPANTPAFEYNTDGTYRGLLVEPAGTNQIRNNTMVGAVAGGAIPTNWTSLSTVGLTRTVVAVGTIDGIEYVDLRYNGTATSTAELNLLFDASTQIVAANGQTWTNSFWFQVIAQPTPATDYRVAITERTVAGATVATGSQVISTPTAWARYSLARTLSGGGTVERVSAEFRTGTLTNGQPYDFTVRIGLPQMETGSVATSVIKTSGTSLTRTADSVTLTGASSLIGQTQGTIYAMVNTRLTAGSSSKVLCEIRQDGNNRIRILKLTNDGFQAIGTSGGVEQFAISSATGQSGMFRIALAYNANDIALYINGVQIGTDASATIPATSIIGIGVLGDGTLPFNDCIRSFATFPTRLPNATLAALTA